MSESSYNFDDIDPVLFILNEKNKKITKKYIEKTLKKYGINIKIKNLKYFQRAMVHTSYQIRDLTLNQKTNKNGKTRTSDLEPIENPKDAIPLQEESYERLEFLGDSVLHLILAFYLWNRYESQDEGFMTRLRTKIENGETLAELCKAIDLNQYIYLSRFIEKNGGRENNFHILEDAFEAFMGALFLEAGFDVCKNFFITLIEKEIDLAKILHVETNYKDTLLQYFHKMGWCHPIYQNLDVSGPDHNKQFTMYVKCKKSQQDDGDIVGFGTSTSKKKGEQKASKQALIKFGVIKADDDDSDSETCEEISESLDDLEELEELSESE